jgi:crossover junction endodeoxyribonuclease RuvC
MRILGIDPGIATVGFGVIEIVSNLAQLREVGVIKTDSKQAIGDRLNTIYQDLHSILKDYKPHRVGMEKLFFYRMGNLIQVAQARGVILLVLGQQGINPHEFSPPQIKQSLTGYGNADKHTVQLAVQRELHLAEMPQPDDAADALAIALTCYFHTQG